MALASGEIPNFLQASSCFSNSSCDLPEGHDARCVRPMSATQTSVTCTRTSCVPGELARFSPRACGKELWGSNRLPRGPGVSRRLDRFGGSSSERISVGAFCASAAWAFSSHDDDAIEPLTPLSPLSSGPGERTFVRIFRAGESRQDRFHRAPVMRLGLVGPRYLPSIRTLRMVQSPLQRWARDRPTSFWEMCRPLHGACHTMRGLGRSCSV